MSGTGWQVTVRYGTKVVEVDYVALATPIILENSGRGLTQTQMAEKVAKSREIRLPLHSCQSIVAAAEVRLNSMVPS